MIFQNRRDAGKKLAEKLTEYKDLKNGLVVALARGGVPVGYEVARALNLPLDVTLPRKIGAPGNPEFAIGAVTETGEGIFSREVSQEMIDREKEKIQERLALYRQGKPLDLKDKVVILIDDGLATGFTMKAAILSAKKQHPTEIIVAVPVAPPRTAEEIRGMVDHLICLHTFPNFRAIGLYYENFSQTSDQEVIELLKRRRQ